MTNEIQTMGALKQALVTQNQHGEALIAVIERMEAQEQRIDRKVTTVEDLVEKVSKEITINYEEQKQIQSLVSTLAGHFAKIHMAQQHQNFSDNLFKAWKGLFINRIYAKLKIEMNVVRYTAIQREHYKTAWTFLDTMTYNNFTLRELQPTISVLKILELERQN